MREKIGATEAEEGGGVTEECGPREGQEERGPRGETTERLWEGQ